MSQICPTSTSEVREGETIDTPKAPLWGQCYEQGIRSEPIRMGNMWVRMCRSEARKGHFPSLASVCLPACGAQAAPSHPRLLP